jgi:hypothetical protein
MSEEKRDPLQELLMNRRKADEQRTQNDSTTSKPYDLPEALPHQTTIINT